MASNLPLWYGRERGTSLASLVTFDEEPDDRGGFLERLGDRLFGNLADLPCGVVGFFVPFLALATATGAASAASAGLAAALALALLAWTSGCAAAAWRAWREGDSAPAWARGIVAVLVAFGRVVIVIAIVASIVAVLVALLSLIMGASMSER